MKAVGDSFVILVPITKLPDFSKLTGVPEIVTPGPPAEIFVPATKKAVGLAVKVWPPTVKTDGEASLDSILVLVPMTKFPEGPKLTNVPEIVTPGPPADSVVPAIANAAVLGVKT